MPAHISPQGGRLLRRSVSGGAAWAGILHLPSEFVPEEGRAYGCLMAPSGILLDPDPVTPALPKHMESHGAGDLLTSNIWPRPAVPKALSVRFIQAFPEVNSWTVVAPSPYPVNPGQPDHAWFDVSKDGQVCPIDPPFNAAGEGFGNLLARHAVWPDRQGVLHTLPQLMSATRAPYFNYHKLLVQAARDPEVMADLAVRIRKNPAFQNFAFSPPEPMFCDFLSRMEERGLLDMDRPYTAVEYQCRQDVIREVFRESKAAQDTAPSRFRPR